jgi:hypothetical protein
VAITSVLDYQRMGKSDKPRRLHRTDCPHPYPQALYRAATPDELRTLPRCHDCEVRESKEA